MRLRCLGALVLMTSGCSVASAPIRATTPLPGAVAVAVPLSTLPPSTAPTKPEDSILPKPVGVEQRQQARTAFRPALEAWSAGRVQEAQAMVDLGLLALGRRLPDDKSDERLFNLAQSASLSADGRILALGDRETIYVADAASGFVLGLRLHDFGDVVVAPKVSPKGTYVVAPAADRLVVYETRGLVQRAVISARDGAPFAFLDDEHVVTVRLGASETVPPAPSTDSRGYVVRELTELKPPATSKAQPSVAALTQARRQEAASSTAAEPGPSSPNEQADDELLVVELKTGKVQKILKLTTPPDQGLLRRVASLPSSEDCSKHADCERFAFNPIAIGRRVDSLKVGAGVVSAVWHGGSVSLHRVRDGLLIGAFRARGERWKPGLVAVVDNPPRAAVATSTPELGRGNEPAFSVTALVDLRLGKVVELMDDCRWATGLSFSLDGRSLMVGDLRRACLHDARTGRLLDTTEEVRPSAGPQDELQDVDVRPVQSGRWLLRTADGAYGVFDGNNGKALLRGRQDRNVQGYVATDDQSLYVADYSAQRAELVILGQDKVERRILRLEELEQKQYPPEARNTPEGRLASALQVLTLRSCLIEGFRLPGELCRLTAGKP